VTPQLVNICHEVATLPFNADLALRHLTTWLSLWSVFRRPGCEYFVCRSECEWFVCRSECECERSVVTNATARHSFRINYSQ
jgi:hypothetical protein